MSTISQEQAADIYLSMACGCFSTLRRMEPSHHTRRARELAKLEERAFALLVQEYGSVLASREAQEVAANVIRLVEANLNADLLHEINDGSEM